MRQFTNRNSFLNNDGEPLVGRITFYDKDTTKKADIYDVDHTKLSNPIYTNNIGQCETQVFLDNKDYTVVFEKYIGDKVMKDEADENEYWEFQYSCVNLFDVYDLNIDYVDGFSIVPSIEVLRRTVPENAGNVVLLLGYYEPGDMTGVFYKWNNTGTIADNNGTIIVTPSPTGRWEMIEGQGYDARKFGVFPSTTMSDLNSDQTTRIAIASSVFPYLEFNLPGLYRLDRNIVGKFVDDAKVIVPDEYNVTVTALDKHVGIGQGLHYQGGITVNGDKLALSNLVSYNIAPDYTKVTYSPNVSMDIDRNVHINMTFENIDVYFSPNVVSIDNAMVTLKSCDISGQINKDMSVTFYDTYIKEHWFATDNVLTYAFFFRCSSEIDEWNDTAKFISFWSKCQNLTNLDMKNRTYTGALDILNKNSDTVWIKNGTIDVNGNETKLVLDNVHGNIAVGNDITIYNSEIILSMAAGHNLSSYDSNITLSYSTVFDIMTLTNSRLVGTSNFGFSANSVISNSSYVGPTITILSKINAIDAKYTEFAGVIVVDNNYKFDKCTFHSSIQCNSTDQTIYFEIMNCTFGANAYHYLASTIPDSLVYGSWVNNVANTQFHFIVLDRTNLDDDDKQHKYLYAGNTGKKVIPSKINQKIQTTVLPTTAGIPTEGSGFTSNDQVTAIYLRQFGYFYVEFFSIGTKNISKDLNWNISPTVYMNGDERQQRDTSDWTVIANTWNSPTFLFPVMRKNFTDKEYEFSNETYKNLSHVQDYVWNISYGHGDGATFYKIKGSGATFETTKFEQRLKTEPQEITLLITE